MARGRRWSPKHAVRCPHCLWLGKRTARMTSKNCPRCRRYGVVRIEPEKPND